MASTKQRIENCTYAQKYCCAAASKQHLQQARYQSNSECKSLIYIESSNCFFCGQSVESLDLQGIRRLNDKLSTKLSTENLEICKRLLNQALSGLTGSGFEETELSLVEVKLAPELTPQACLDGHLGPQRLPS